jgi:hypothetical protein
MKGLQSSELSGAQSERKRQHVFKTAERQRKIDETLCFKTAKDVPKQPVPAILDFDMNDVDVSMELGPRNDSGVSSSRRVGTIRVSRYTITERPVSINDCKDGRVI